MHIIDADKLLEVIEVGIMHSHINASIQPINSKGEYDLIADVVRRCDYIAESQLKVIKQYIIENMI